MLCLIAAVAENRVIGKDSKLPWHIPGDLKRFKEITMDRVVIMGRKTFESIGRPLPKRINIVVSTTMPPQSEVLVSPSLTSAIDMGRSFQAHFKLPEEIMVIGGARVYQESLSLAGRLYLTKVVGHYEGDTLFPELDLTTWKVSKQEDFPTHSFVVYDRKQ